MRVEVQTMSDGKKTSLYHWPVVSFYEGVTGSVISSPCNRKNACIPDFAWSAYKDVIIYLTCIICMYHFYKYFPSS